MALVKISSGLVPLWRRSDIYRTSVKRQRWFSSQKGGISLVDLSMSNIKDAKSQAELTQALQDVGVLKRQAVIEAFRETDRALFIDDRLNDPEKGRFMYAEPYSNAPVKIGYTGATMSTPHHHATVTELISDCLESGDRVLDLGCGSGYLAAIFSKLVRNTECASSSGVVVAVECVPELMELSASNLSKAGCEQNIILLPAFDNTNDNSGTQGEFCKNIFEEKFKVIHVSFAMDQKTVESQLMPHLSPGGKMVVPITIAEDEENTEQVLTVFQKKQETEEVTANDVMTVLCQPMKADMINDIPQKPLAERISDIQAKLKVWTEDYTVKHGKTPSREEMFRDEEASKLFKEFARLRQNKW